MRNVYLKYALHRPLNKETKAPALALWRRMSPLQKAVLSVYLQAADERKELFQQLKDTAAPLYFASAYGEVSAMLGITESIAENSLPVSPKDFQHSVLNASLAYVGMQAASHAPGYAISGGFASIDKALHLAARRIAAGLDESSILLHAHEWVGDKEEARAEILVLSADAEGSDYALDEIREGKGSELDPDFDERRDTGHIPWMLIDNKPQVTRQVRNIYNTVFLSRWRAIP